MEVLNHMEKEKFKDYTILFEKKLGKKCQIKEPLRTATHI